MDAGRRRDLFHGDPIAEAVVDEVARPFERGEVAWRCGEGCDAAEKGERTRLDLERLASFGIAIQRQELPCGSRAGEIAHGAEARPIDLRPFHQLRPELEHEKANTRRPDGVLMLDLRWMKERRESVERE